MCLFKSEGGSWGSEHVQVIKFWTFQIVWVHFGGLLQTQFIS